MFPLSPFDQSGFQVRLDWGKEGAKAAAREGNLLIVCDVLRFSSAVVTAVACGAIIYPCPTYGDPLAPQMLARLHNASLSVRSREIPEKGVYSLSPQTFLNMPPGEKIVIESLNGSVCASLAAEGATVFAGCLLNADAVAKAVQKEAVKSGKPITVLSCGERPHSPNESGGLRFAIEDYLGAGAILSSLDLSLSPEAEVCAAAWRGSQDRIQDILWNCGSGRELRDKELGADVEFVSQLNLYSTVPRLTDGAFREVTVLHTIGA